MGLVFHSASPSWEFRTKITRGDGSRGIEICGQAGRLVLSSASGSSSVQTNCIYVGSNWSPKRLAAFAADGGRVEVYLQLNGEMNAGDRYNRHFGFLAEVRAEMQIEVFPHFK